MLFGGIINLKMHPLGSTLLAIAGLVITPLKPVPANTPVTVVIEGI